MTYKMIFIAVLSLFLAPRSFSQERIVICSSEKNSDNSYTIYAENLAFADYTVKLNFTTLTGYTTSLSSGYFRTISPGKSQVIKLTPMNNGSGPRSFNYSYRYYPGKCFNRSPDTSLVYLLPSTPGNALRVAKVTSMEERLGQKRTDEFHAAGFIYKLGDTICASRAGTVYLATDDDREGEKTSQTYTDKRNKISIEHRDGTLGHYSILAPIKLLVGKGDKVIPGQPLAIFDKESDKYHVFMSAYYLDEKRMLEERTDPTTSRPVPNYIQLPMEFYSGENTAPLKIHNTYVVAHPKEIIAAELSKKEKKKLGL